MFCYDLFRRAGIWTAAFDVYCRVWVYVEGDSKAAYYGVYEMIEPYDDKYVAKSKDFHEFFCANSTLGNFCYGNNLIKARRYVLKEYSIQCYL